MSLIEAASKLPDNRPAPARDARAMMAEIEATRRAVGLSCETLSNLAGVSISSYRRYVAGERQPGGASLRRLARALLARQAQRPLDDRLMRGLAVRMLEELARQAAAPKPRNLAIYLAHTELGLPQRQIAQLLGVSSNYIHVVVRQVEERRDDGTPIDKALLEIGALLDSPARAQRGAA